MRSTARCVDWLFTPLPLHFLGLVTDSNSLTWSMRCYLVCDLVYVIRVIEISCSFSTAPRPPYTLAVGMYVYVITYNVSKCIICTVYLCSSGCLTMLMLETFFFHPCPSMLLFNNTAWHAGMLCCCRRRCSKAYPPWPMSFTFSPFLVVIAITY